MGLVDVSREQVTSREAILAVRTCVWLVAGMRPHVPSDMLWSGERGQAHGTLVVAGHGGRERERKKSRMQGK